MTELDDLPPSRRHVRHVLTHHGPLTVTKIQERTNLSRRTVHRALSDLSDAADVDRHTDPENANRTLYDTQDVTA